MNYINKKQKTILVALFFMNIIFISNSKLHAQSAWMVQSYNTNFPQVTNYDNATIQKLLNIRKDFNSGETISASVMNEKFEQIFSILEDLTNMSVDAEPLTNILIYGTENLSNGNLGGINGANNLCTSDSNRTNLRNYGNITCTDVKAVLESNSQSIDTLYPEQGYKFYSYKGEIISESWSEFLNWQVSNFAEYETSFWSGQMHHCQDWNSESEQDIGMRGRVINGQVINFLDTSSTCKNSQRLLCSCKFYSN